MEISIEWLRRQSACNLDNKWYTQKLASPATLTSELIHSAHEAGVLDAVWLAEKVLPPPLWAEYKRQRASLWAEYERQQMELLITLFFNQEPLTLAA